MLRGPGRGIVVMTREFFERHYGILSDQADAVEVFGNKVQRGVATVGDIRSKLADHMKNASIYPEPDGSALCIADAERKSVCRLEKKRHPAIRLISRTV